MNGVNWPRVVADFSLGAFPLQVAYALIGPAFAPRLQVSLCVINVRTGLPTVVIQTSELLPELGDDEAAAGYLFNSAMALVEHELAEQARFRGRRVFEPHGAS